MPTDVRTIAKSLVDPLGLCGGDEIPAKKAVAAALRNERAAVDPLRKLLVRCRRELEIELISNLDANRGWIGDRRQTDEEVLANTAHEDIDDSTYRQMNRWKRLIDEIDAALS